MQETSQQPGSGDGKISSIAANSTELARTEVNAADLEKAKACLALWEDQALRLATPMPTGELKWRLWGQGAPLILIHGGAGAWSHWVRNLDALISQYRVIAPDTPGLGDSSSPPSPYTPESIAELLSEGLLEVLERQGYPEYVEIRIVGFSFGGMIAGLVATRLEAARANRVKKLVLIGASGLGGHFADLEPVAKLPAGENSSALRAVHFHNLRVMMLHDPRHIDELALLVQAINAPKTRVLSPKEALSHRLENALRKTPIPLHSLWGENCIFAPDLQRRRELLGELDPSAEFIVIPGAGHWVQFEAATRVNHELLRLLA